MCASWAATPSEASSTTSATWHRSRLLSAMTTASFSSGSCTRPFRRMPAVSTSTYVRPSYTRVVSTAPRVDHEQDEVRLVDGSEYRAADALDQGLLGRRIEATGVDHRGLPALEADAPVKPVPRHAGRVADERLTPADQTVEEGRLADVRTTDDGDDRADHFFLPRRPATRTTTAPCE